jgi:hypothetical protein
MTKKRITIKKSQIEGYGVFTCEPLKKGALIAELIGSKVTYHEDIHGQSNRYPNWFGLGKNTWIDPLDEFQYLNHSCKPNAGLKGKFKLKLYALRDIANDEEVTIDYSTTESDPEFCFENYEPPHDFYRKFIGPITSLPIPVYLSYLPYIPVYFQKVYEKEVLYKKP